MKFLKHIVLISIVLSSINIYSQVYSRFEDWIVGANAGINTFWGDVTDNENHFIPAGPFQKGFYNDRNPMWFFSLGKSITPTYSLKFQTAFCNFSSNSSADKKYMKGNLQDFSLIFSYDFLDLFTKSKKSDWDIYGFAGIGLCRLRSVLYNSINNEIISFSPNDSNKYFSDRYLVVTSIPIGVGVNYKINKHWVLNFETSMRYYGDKLDADYIDKRSAEGLSYSSIGIIYHFNLPRGGSFFNRSINHSFDAQKDNTAKVYRKKRSNGSIASDPQKNRLNKRSPVKNKIKRKKLFFKTPK